MKDVWLNREGIARISGGEIILDQQKYQTILGRNGSQQTMRGNDYLGFTTNISPWTLEAELIRTIRDNPDLSKLVHTVTLHYRIGEGDLPQVLFSVTPVSGPNLRESALLTDLSTGLGIPNRQLNLVDMAHPDDKSSCYDAVKLIVHPYNPSSRYQDVFRAAGPQPRLW